MVRFSSRAKKIQILLEEPICASSNDIVAIEAKNSQKGIYTLAGHARIYGGDCCTKGTEDTKNIAEEQDHGSGGNMDEPSWIYDSDQEKDVNDCHQKKRSNDLLERDEVYRTQFLKELQAKTESSSKNNEEIHVFGRLRVPTPQLERDGGAHVRVENFGVIAASLRRDPKHLVAFLSKEGGLSSSLAGTNGSVLRVQWRGGRGFPQRIHSILKKYIVTFVTCQECRGAITELRAQSGGTWEVQCRRCNAHRFVPSL